MEFLKKIPPNIYLIFSLVLITTAIATLFVGKFIIAAITTIIGITSLIAWTFLGLFEETKNT
tara:strand:+ start:1023 stop:1208 length:186 start_codon:yes stop_codon:yes gene_type:complete